MAKFKVGDKVESVKSGAKGVVDEVYGEEKYAVLFDGATNPDRVEGFQITLANSAPASANAVVQNAINARTARNADDNYYLSAKKSIEDAGRMLASAVISLSRSNAPNSASIHEELVKMSDAFERIRKRL